MLAFQLLKKAASEFRVFLYSPVSLIFFFFKYHSHNHGIAYSSPHHVSTMHTNPCLYYLKQVVDFQTWKNIHRDILFFDSCALSVPFFVSSWFAASKENGVNPPQKKFLAWLEIEINDSNKKGSAVSLSWVAGNRGKVRDCSFLRGQTNNTEWSVRENNF